MRLLSIVFASLLLLGFAQNAPLSPESVEWGPWWTVLPFEHPAGGASIKEEYSPEEDLRRMRAGGPGPKLERKHRRQDRFSITWQQIDTADREDPDFGLVDFNKYVPAELQQQEGYSNAKTMAYAYRTVTTSKKGQVLMRLGSDDGCRVWLNGKEIYSAARNRGVDPVGDDLLLDLSSGVNHLLAKVPNEGGAWGLHVHPPSTSEVSPSDYVSQSAVNEAIDRGVLYLLKTQLLDGSWDYHADPYRNGQTALSTYALMKSGLAPTHPCIRRAFQFMGTKPSDRTYELACELLAKKARGTKQDLRDVESMGELLVDWEQNGLAYPVGSPCLSNTQYGAMGMLVAQREGAKISPRVWTSMVRFAFQSQNEDGGFGYRNGVPSSGSMTAAGLIVLRAAELSFGKKGLPTKIREKHEESVARGLNWFAENFRVDQNPKAQDNSDRWLYYYLYGIERLAALYGLEKIGTHDWYWEGATFLIRKQNENGSWSTRSGEAESNTAFALIFLDRATAALTGQAQTNNRKRNYVTDQNDSEVVLRATGDTPLSLWVSGFHEDEIDAHSRTVKGEQGLLIDRVEYYADGELVETLKGDPRRPWSSERFAVQHKFYTRREHEVQVRVHLTPDPTEPDEPPTVLSSPILKVRVDEGSGVWMLDYPDDWLSNLLLQQEVKALASSERDNGNRPALAIDGRMGTGWSCKADDLTPTLTLNLDSGARADTVVLSHRTSTELNRGDFDRATLVELRVNGESETYQIEMNPDEDYKTAFELPKSLRIHELSIRVLERLKGNRYPGTVGFAEVELRLKP